MARLSCAALLCAAFLAAAAVRAADDVIAVSGEKQLNALVKEHPFLVVEFYAPWCGHCKKLEPEWAKAATALKGHDPPIVLAKVDATAKENESFKDKYGIRGFPTIKIFRGDADKAGEYQGPRDAAGIEKFLKKQVLPAYTQLDSKEAIQQAIKAADALMLAYIDSNTSAEFKTFAQVAEGLRNDLDFAYVTDHSLLEECTTDCTSPFVVMYKAGESEQPRYSGDFTEALLQTWAQAKSVPLVIKFGSDSGMKYIQKAFSSKTPRLIAGVKKEDPELLEQLRQASKANDDLFVVWAEQSTGKRLIDYFGLPFTPGSNAVLLIDDPTTSHKYIRQDAKPSDVPEFIREFKEGALEEWVKSEDIPADNSGPVRIVVGRTFEEEVLKGGKDVFIELYAPWCVHCKKLEPIWNEVAKELEGDQGVVIAKMDATANDVPTPKITVRGFPMLVYVTAKGEVIPYSGDRSKAELLKFVSSKRTLDSKGKVAADEDDEDDVEEEEEEAPKDEL